MKITVVNNLVKPIKKEKRGKWEVKFEPTLLDRLLGRKSYKKRYISKYIDGPSWDYFIDEDGNTVDVYTSNVARKIRYKILEDECNAS